VPDLSVDNNALQGLSPEFAKAYQMTLKAERRPVDALEVQKEKLQSKVDLLGDLVGRADSLRKVLPGLGTPFAFREVSLTSDDPKILTGTADKSQAELGKHDLEILQLASGPSALSNRFPDPDETRIGTGYLIFKSSDGESREIFIDSDNSTLEGVAQSINRAKLGITASVVNDVSDPENSYRLLLSTSSVGEKSDIDYPEFYFSGGEEDFFVEEKKDAGNAVIKYRGLQIESPSNELKDLIPGAVLNLKGITDPGRPVTVTLDQDVPQTVVKVKDLVEKTNAVLGFIQEQNKVDEKTDTSRTLGGDYALRLAEERIRAALRENFIGQEGRNVQSLSDVGIQITREGVLSLDEKKFAAALEKNFDEVVSLISGDGTTTGVIPKLNRAVATLSAPGTGVLSSQKKNYDNQILTLNKNIERTEKIIAAKAESLRNSLSRAQAAVQALQGQSAQMAGSLAGAVPGVSPAG